MIAGVSVEKLIEYYVNTQREVAMLRKHANGLAKDLNALNERYKDLQADHEELLQDYEDACEAIGTEQC